MIRTQIWASGGGVQSAAMAALIVQGRLRPDLAVIIDTEREQSTTWTYMDEIISPALAAVGLTLNRVKKSEFESIDLFSRNGTPLIPAFTSKSGEIGKLNAFCSSYWKREVIKRWANSKGVMLAETWLGISVDEMTRIQADRRGNKWKNRYPLVELAMNRGDCMALVDYMGWPHPPRSSCWMCPNHTQQEWRDIRDNKPADWQAAIKFERDLHKTDPHAYLHGDCRPLEECDIDDRNGTLFDHSCNTGHCFV